MQLSIKKKIKSTLNRISKIGFFHLLSANLILQIVGLGIQIFLARILSVDDIGRIRIIQSFISIATIIAGLGVNTAILKLCSEDIDNNKKKIIFINGIKFNFITSLVVLIVCIICSVTNIYSADNIINMSLRYYSVIIPFSVFNDLGIVYLQSQKKIKDMSRIQIITKVISVLFIMLFSMLFSLNGFIFAYIITGIISFLIFIILFKNELNGFSRIKITKKHIKDIFNIGKYAFATNSIGQILASVDVLFMNYLINDNSRIGFFGIAQLIIGGLMIVPSTFNQIIVPYVSENCKSKNKVIEIYNGYYKKMISLMFSVIVISFFVIPIFIPVIFGSKYVSSISYFRIMLVGFFFWSITATRGIILLGIGQIKYNFYVSLITACFNLIFNYVFILKFGAKGAAYGTVLGYFLGSIVSKRIFYKAINNRYI